MAFVLLSSENAALLKKRRWYVDPPKHFRGNLFCSIRVKTYQIVQGNYDDDHFASSWSSETYTLWEDALFCLREDRSQYDQVRRDMFSPDCSAIDSDRILFPQSAQTGDANNEPAKYCDLKMDAWCPESALYLDNPDPFASMSMIDVDSRYTYEKH